MASVCIGCGLTTDALGNLVINTSGVAGDVLAACSIDEGSRIYCDPATGKVYGEPTRYFAQRRDSREIQSAEVPLTSLAPADASPHNVGQTVSVTLTNPSKCLPMPVEFETGIAHAIVRHSGGGDMLVRIGMTWAITGSVVTSGVGGHQVWRHAGSGSLLFDTMGAFARNNVTIPAGGTITITGQAFIDIGSAGGSSTIENWSIEVHAIGANE